MALVVFLRGVNVGGYKTFRPGALAKDLAEFGVVNAGKSQNRQPQSPKTGNFRIIAANSSEFTSKR